MSTSRTSEALAAELKDLEHRSFRTYRARMLAAQRLEARHHAWSISLLAATTGAVIASVAMLVMPNIYGELGGVLLAALSVVTLVVSLVATGLNHSGRSRNMFVSYRRFQRISVEAENLKRLPIEMLSDRQIDDLQSRYQALLDESENHSHADYLISQEGVNRWQPAALRALLLTNVPYVLIVFPILLLIPILTAITP